MIKRIGNTTKHTHLLRNSLSNYWCGMHRTCKITSVKLDRSGWMTRSEKRCGGTLSTSLLDESTRSDAAQTFKIDQIQFQIATTVQRKLQNDDMEVLGLSLFPSQKIGRYVTVISRDISTNLDPLRWVISQGRGWPPCKNKLHYRRGFTSIQMCHTHTLPRQGFFLEESKGVQQ